MYSQRPVVLLVEDEPDIRRLMVRILEGFPVRTEEADNGASALQLARRLNGSLGLIVTDIDMPVMDGLEFVRILRRSERRVPVLFITGSDPALAAQAGLKGEVLRKPFGVEAFLERVTRMLNSGKTAELGFNQPDLSLRNLKPVIDEQLKGLIKERVTVRYFSFSGATPGRLPGLRV